MKPQKLKLNLFFQYLISYLCVLLIPMLILGTLVYYHFVNVLRDEVILNNQTLLHQIMDTVDVNIEEMRSISAQIPNRPELSPYVLTENFYKAREAKGLLNYTVANEFIDDMFFYIRGGDYLYSSSSTYSIATYIDNLFHYHEWPREEFIEDLNQIKSPLMRPAEDVTSTSFQAMDRIITYIVPIPIHSGSPYGTAIFHVKESTVQRSLVTVMKGKQGNALILDEEGKVITSLEALESDEVEYTQKMWGEGATEGSFRSLSGGSYEIVSYIKSPKSGWTYVMIQPERNYLAPIDGVKLKMLLSMLLILFLSGIIIYYLMSVNYQPLKQLISIAETRKGKSSWRLSGAERVRHAIENLDHLSKQWKQHQPTLRENFLLAMIKGEFRDYNKILEDGGQFGITLPKPEYLVACLQLHRSEDHKTAKQIFTYPSHSSLDPWFQCYTITLFTDQILFILGVDHEPMLVEEGLEELRQFVLDAGIADFTIGVGSSSMVTDLGRSYMEACSAADYRFKYGKNKIVYFNQVAEENYEARPQLRSELEQLKLYVSQGNHERTSETIGRILEHVRYSGLTLFQARYICFELIHTVTVATEELSRKGMRTPKSGPDIFSIQEFETLEELEEAITAYCREIFEGLQEVLQSNDNKLVGKMLQYIQENYNNYTFSIQKMADDLSISSSYLCKYFKEQTEQTVFDHVNMLRLEKAKELLCTTDMTTKEIVMRVGYGDSSSFIRKFKQVVGMTPGEYRKLSNR